MTVFVMRPIEVADIDAVRELAEAFFQFAHERSTYLTPEVLRSFLATPGVDASTDALLVERDGTPVAAALVTASPPYGETGAILVVDPELDSADLQRAIGLVIDGFSAALAPRITSSGAARDPWQRVMMPTSVPGAGAVLADLGFEPLRQVYEMVIDLTAPTANDPAWPAGVRWRTPTTLVRSACSLPTSRARAATSVGSGWFGAPAVAGSGWHCCSSRWPRRG